MRGTLAYRGAQRPAHEGVLGVPAIINRKKCRVLMGARRQSLTLAGLFLLSLFAALAPPSAAHTVEAPESEHEHVVISEFLVSSSNEDFNGTDWNGDGYYCSQDTS